MSKDPAANDSRRVEIDLAELDEALKGVKNAIDVIMNLGDTKDKKDE